MESGESREIPRHIALIMDGNGRWAREKGLDRLQGHYRGYKTLREIVIASADLGVEALTAYAFSSENWRRPESEVSGIMELVRFALGEELDTMKRERVKIIVSGRTREIPRPVMEQFEQDMEETKDNTRITLNIALNYGGRNEIVDAAKKAAQMARDGKISAEDIDEKLISSLMYHPELPDPDLLIRTAGEKRISNFLLWQTAYTELYITETLWPEFTKEELVQAIADYQSRTRKFGKVVDKPGRKADSGEQRA
ncbi:MAG: di-trans,poly-cis-decaprenylcistransferase [Armatimonadetes bacterium RBG_16_58_9]|nr:MAG: di-trans,poly-cis-decaprenylcistransferase [Armatimonadetes bacterium RBG_16_58_9]